MNTINEIKSPVNTLANNNFRNAQMSTYNLKNKNTTEETLANNNLKEYSDTKELFSSNEKEYHELKEDIRKNGIHNPIIVDTDTGEIVCGNRRYKAAIELGIAISEIPIIKRKFKDATEKESLFIKDNLLRRQLSGNQMVELYIKLVPELVEYMDNQDRGKNNGKDNPINKLHELTGKKKETIRKQISRYKESKSKKENQDLQTSEQSNLSASSATSKDKDKTIFNEEKLRPIVKRIKQDFNRIDAKLKPIFLKEISSIIDTPEQLIILLENSISEFTEDDKNRLISKIKNINLENNTVKTNNLKDVSNQSGSKENKNEQ